MNKTINIFGTKYKIQYVDKVYDTENNWIYGLTDPESKIIKISTINDKDKPIQKEEIELTLHHEVFHAILMSGQYMGYNNDEPLVEWLARCIYSLKKQGLYKD